MQITKYLHSCLFIEDQGTSILIDPGQFTFEANALDLTTLQKIDYLLITHEHADHFYLPFIQSIKERFPNVKIISTPSVVKQLENENISASTEGTDDVRVTSAQHEDIVLLPAPENITFTLFSKLTHPGDSYHFTSDTEILAMPMTAPWGSMAEAMRKVMTLAPKIVIPIHDWHWKDEALAGFYPRIAEHFKQQNIEFKIIKTGEVLHLP